MSTTDTSKSIITSIWGSAVGMMAIIGIFVGSNSNGKALAMAVPPIAAGATTAVILNHEAKERRLHGDATTLQRMEARLQNLEAILAQETPPFVSASPPDAIEPQEPQGTRYNRLQ
ncbi:MAG: hypothetical protein IGS50_13330 [Synechococcales cyanobacterium C42_A2020_086]|jgi:hypothetical protein|nr:hypothetical protein [Synechococcales cyanobacterium M58_A2018_015]MBF2074729.1 hypothetical protein [Synechococcales cyanobacterium C42_A2020_086]